MKQHKEPDNKNRRRFLGLTATTGSAALLAGIKGQASKDPLTEENHISQQARGYRITAHIKKYYRKARI